TGIKDAYQGVRGACPQQAVTKHQRHGQVLASANWDETCVPELRLNMCTRGSRGRSPRQAVTSTGGTAEC
ncbi:hypothetical protein K443DRAFT_113790, partial [Laccaria amethystina LaAM-08-1]